MKKLIFTFSLLFIVLSGIIGKDKPTQTVKFVIEDAGISLNEQDLKADHSIEYYEAIFGKYNLTENRADGLYYTWDKLGIKLREDGETKFINQVSIFLTIVGTSTTKFPYKGKLTVLGKDITLKTSPSKIMNDMICQQIFCAFKLDTKTVYANLTSDQKKFQYILITLP